MKYKKAIEFGKNLRAERIRQGYSLESLGEKINLNPTHIGKIERAVLSPILPTFLALLSGLNLKLEDLVKLD